MVKKKNKRARRTDNWCVCVDTLEDSLGTLDLDYFTSRRGTKIYLNTFRTLVISFELNSPSTLGGGECADRTGSPVPPTAPRGTTAVTEEDAVRCRGLVPGKTSPAFHNAHAEFPPASSLTQPC